MSAHMNWLSRLMLPVATIGTGHRTSVLPTPGVEFTVLAGVNVGGKIIHAIMDVVTSSLKRWSSYQ